MPAGFKPEQLHYMLAVMPGMVYWKNHQGEYEGCNYNYAKAVGLAAPEAICGKTDFDLFPEKTAQSQAQQDNDLMQAGIEKSYESTIPNLDNSSAIYFIEKFPLRGQAQEVCGLLSIAIDITERKLLAHELVTIKSQLAHLETECHQLGSELEGVQSRLATADLDAAFFDKMAATGQIKQFLHQATQVLSNAEPLSVLLIEDDNIAMAVAKQALEELNCRVTTAVSVYDANDKINAVKYDFIVSDINLSAGSGIDIARHVTQNAAGLNQKTPLIAVTLHGDKQMRTKLQNVGFSAILHKPLDKRELAETIRNLVPATNSPTHKETKVHTGQAVLDMSIAISRLGNEKFAIEILQKFMEELPPYRHTLKACYDNNDLRELREQLHKMQGSLSYVGAPELTQAVMDLHKAIGSTHDLHGLAPFFLRIDQAINSLEQEYKRNHGK